MQRLRQLRLFLIGLMAFHLSGSIASAGLPAEITVTAATPLEILRDDHVRGTVTLTPGTKLELVNLADEYVLVRYRNLNGRVLARCTDLPREPATLPAPSVKPAPAATVAEPVKPAAATAPRVLGPATALERELAGKLVVFQGDAIKSFDSARLAGVKFYALYFSASWCGPCRQFTPELIDAFGKIRALYPEFELVLVNRDNSAADMAAYMRADKMPWPALAWKAIRDAAKINRYAGDGIPDLVLLDADGNVLSDSYRWGRYVGPDAVLEDTWKILRDYRRKNPRPKA